jgi:hypothetical protein
MYESELYQLLALVIKMVTGDTKDNFLETISIIAAINK